MKAEKIANKVWKIFGGVGLSSHVYLVDLVEPTLIDLGSFENTPALIEVLKGLGYEAKDIVKVVFTHLHLDHVGQPSKFENARFFASKEELDAFKASPFGSVFADKSIGELNKIKLEPLDKEIAGMEVIKTPGHTVGSICLLLPKEGILFSGDTLFEGGHGRVDLETSVPEKIEGSLERLKLLKYKILCPGH